MVRYRRVINDFPIFRLVDDEMRNIAMIEAFMTPYLTPIIPFKRAVFS